MNRPCKSHHTPSNRSKLEIPRVFRGPNDSANGGYTAGLLTASLQGPAEVTLRRPPPLAQPLWMTTTADKVELHHEKDLIAEAVPTQVAIDTPPPPSLAQAEAAAAPLTANHPFPECYVCGPARAAGDGLHIFPGHLLKHTKAHENTGTRFLQSSRVAASWTPDPALANAQGEVATPFLWAALDCPGGLAFPWETDGAAVLGRLAVRQERPVIPSRPHIVLGWTQGRDGRKRYAGTALFTADGELCAVGRATWIELRPAPSSP